MMAALFMVMVGVVVDPLKRARRPAGFSGKIFWYDGPARHFWRAKSVLPRMVFVAGRVHCDFPTTRSLAQSGGWRNKTRCAIPSFPSGAHWLGPDALRCIVSRSVIGFNCSPPFGARGRRYRLGSCLHLSSVVVLILHIVNSPRQLRGTAAGDFFFVFFAGDIFSSTSLMRAAPFADLVPRLKDFPNRALSRRRQGLRIFRAPAGTVALVPIYSFKLSDIVVADAPVHRYRNASWPWAQGFTYQTRITPGKLAGIFSPEWLPLRGLLLPFFVGEVQRRSGRFVAQTVSI